jgi:DNA-binding PadR family transcriptional regulator
LKGFGLGLGMGKGMGFAPGFWLRAFVLFALSKEELHGYELLNMMEKYFPEFSFYKGPSGMGTGYRILRMLEMEGLIGSRWETGEGPAKRVYFLTPLGERVKNEIIEYIKDMRDRIEKFLEFAEGKEV